MARKSKTVRSKTTAKRPTYAADTEHGTALAICCVIAETIGPLLKGDTEIVIHDLLNLDRSAVLVVNGHVSGRSRGQAIITAPGKSERFQEMMARKAEPHEVCVSELEVVTVDATSIKSRSIVFYDAKARPAVALCINVDSSVEAQIERSLRTLFTSASERVATQFESRETRLDDLVEEIIRSALAREGATPERLTTAERLRAVQQMHERGLFQIRGSVELVAKRMKTSKFTVYSYLDRLGIKRSSEAQRAPSGRRQSAGELE